MSSSRFFILSILAERGPMHGHQIRLQAAEDRTEQWTEVKAGALYGALARLAREGLIEAVRTERAGHYPERVIYEITADGRRALAALHDAMLRTVVIPADPFDLALAHSGTVAEETLRQVATTRLADFQARRNAAQCQLDAAEPWLTPAEHIVLEHLTARLDAEIRWHKELLNRIPKIVRDEPTLPEGRP